MQTTDVLINLRYQLLRFIIPLFLGLYKRCYASCILFISVFIADPDVKVYNSLIKVCDEYTKFW